MTLPLHLSGVVARLTARWSAAKGTTGYSYDTTGNLTNSDYPTSVDVQLQYDLHDRLTHMVDALGTSAFGYWPGGAQAIPAETL